MMSGLAQMLVFAGLALLAISLGSVMSFFYREKLNLMAFLAAVGATVLLSLGLTFSVGAYALHSSKLAGGFVSFLNVVAGAFALWHACSLYKPNNKGLLKSGIVFALAGFVSGMIMLMI